MKANLVSIAKTPKGEWLIQFSTYEQSVVKQYDKLKDKMVDISLKAFKEKRSLNANAYFHALNAQIAGVMNISEDECKKMMVLQYGTQLEAEDEVVVVQLPTSVNADTVYPYAKWFDVLEYEGKYYNQFILYKQTRYCNAAEMARLIEGVTWEAKELGIPTRDDIELKRIIEAWEGE